MDDNNYFQTILEYKLLAKHEVGQNFLIDKEVCKKIVGLLNINENDSILEIGSGAGSLSFYLSKYKNNVTMIDIDEGLVTKLKNDFIDQKNVNVLQKNALKFEMNNFTKIIGNLPYYITSNLLEHILLTADKCEISAIMVQKEVYSRISAKLKEEGYGPLSLLIAYRSIIKREFNVPRTSFSPTPHIDSTVFTLHFKNDVSLIEARKLYEFTSKIFLHRRKTILNNLSSYLNDNELAKEILTKADIPFNKRPEEIDLNTYLFLLSLLN